MINYTVRFTKRFLVLVPGIIIAYISASTVYPLFDRRVAQVLAIFLTYVLTAYVLIPVGIRILRIFIPARHLPLYCVTPDGFASDPINIGVIGTKQELASAMQAAGWSIADKHTLRNIALEVISTILRRQYPSAPMSSLYLFGRKQDVGFELLREGRGHRHHVRFWATTFEKDQELSVRTIHWSPRRQKHSENESVLWLGAASRDIGLTLIRHNAQITHMIHPDTDNERDFIIEQLSHNQITPILSVRLDRPYKLVNRAWRGYLQTDGILKIYKLNDRL